LLLLRVEALLAALMAAISLQMGRISLAEAHMLLLFASRAEALRVLPTGAVGKRSSACDSMKSRQALKPTRCAMATRSWTRSRYHQPLWGFGQRDAAHLEGDCRHQGSEQGLDTEQQQVSGPTTTKSLVREVHVFFNLLSSSVQPLVCLRLLAVALAASQALARPPQQVVATRGAPRTSAGPPR